MSKYGLGKGLGALIPQNGPPEDIDEETKSSGVFEELKQEPAEQVQKTPVPEAAVVPNNQVINVWVEEVVPNPYQPRKTFDPQTLQELADSIREHGILQPLVVTRRTDGKYELISGERRLEASKLLGLKEVPVIVRYAEVADKEKLEMALIENIQRQDLDLIEQARAFQRLNKEFNLSYNQVADKVGKSRPAVSNIVRLLQLPVEVQRGVIEGKIAEGHARALLQVADRERQLALYNMILKKKLNTEQTTEIAKEWTVRPHLRKTMNARGDEAASWENLLKSRLGLQRVKIVFAQNGGGRIYMSFLNNDDFKALVEKINTID